MNTLVETVFTVSDLVNNGRSLQDITLAAMAELGELSEEVQIYSGNSYKAADADGVVGEAVDVLLCVLDVIRRYDPTITEEDLAEIAKRKGAKWIAKEVEHQHAQLNGSID